MKEQRAQDNGAARAYIADSAIADLPRDEKVNLPFVQTALSVASRDNPERAVSGLALVELDADGQHTVE